LNEWRLFADESVWVIQPMQSKSALLHKQHNIHQANKKNKSKTISRFFGLMGCARRSR